MPTLPANQWPLVLAGPIVRRVEPGRVSVWVALKEPRSVRLTVFPAPVDTGSGTGVFAGPAPVLDRRRHDRPRRRAAARRRRHR